MKRLISLVMVLVLLLCGLSHVPISAKETEDIVQTGAYPNWYNLYFDFMVSGRYYDMNKYYTEYYSTGVCFMLYDLNFDGVPELLTNNGWDDGAAPGNYVYAIKNGKVISVGTVGFRSGNMFYHMNSDYRGLYCQDAFGNMGAYCCRYYYMENYKIKSKLVMSIDGSGSDVITTVDNEQLYSAYKKATNATDDYYGMREGKYYLNGYKLRGTSKEHFIKQFQYLAIPKITKFENVSSGTKITWNSIKGAEKYRLYRKTSSGWTAVVTTSSTSYTHKISKSNSTYTYTVRCLSGDGSRFTSGFISSGFKNTFIAQPKITKFENVNGGTKITWGKVAGASKYRLFKKTSSGWSGITTTTGTSYTYKISKSNSTYTYTVRCISSDGKKYTSSYNASGYKYKYIATPQLRSVTNKSDGVRFVFKQVAGAPKYRIFRKTAGTSWKKVADVSNKKDYCLDKTAKKGVKYTYTVRCVSADGTKFVSGYNSTGLAITRK